MHLLKYIKQSLFVITIGFLFCLIFYNFSDKSEDPEFEDITFANLTLMDNETMEQTSDPPTPNITLPGVVALIGKGFGNKLFQVASSYALARQLNVPVYFVSKGHSEKDITEAFELTSSETDINFVPSKAWNEIYGRIRISKYSCINFFFDRINKTLTETNLIYLNDFCHSERNFAEYSTEVKDLFKLKEDYLKTTSVQFRNWKMAILDKKGKNSTSSAIYISRGNYLDGGKHEPYYTTPFSFFNDAIETMLVKICRKTVTFYIFSDDVEYVKKNFNTSYEPTEAWGKKNCTSYPEFIYVSPEVEDVGTISGLTSLEEFLLMMLCENIIISNNSFSWWAAYLNGNEKKIVIGPTFHPDSFENERNKFNKRFKSFMLGLKYPNTWITLDPYNGTGL